MKSAVLLAFIVLCSLCLLVTSSPTQAELTERETDEVLETNVERAIDTLDEVFNNIKRVSSPERRDWIGNVWDNVKTYWRDNKQDIIKTGLGLLFGGK